MKLDAITIAGFRGFVAKQEIDLSADATIVVGVNGLGKTSLFDAIQWGLCGHLVRVGDDSRIVSLYSTTGEAQVSLSLRDQLGSTLTIKRSTDGKDSSVQVVDAGKEFKGASATAHLNERLWPDAALSTDGNTILSSALTRSVYLQQDRVRDFLDAATDQERFNIISELVGTGRLTELQLQLDKQRTSWTRATNQIQKDGASIEQRVETLTRQLDKLQKSAMDDDNKSSVSWPEWWKSSIELGVSIRETPSIDSVDASTSLDVAIRDLEGLRDGTQRRKSAATALQEILLKEPVPAQGELDVLREALAKATANTKEIRTRLEKAKALASELRQSQIATEEAKEQQRALAQLALKLLTDKCPVCLQDYDVEQTRQCLLELVAVDAPKTEAKSATVDDVVTISKQEKEAVDLESKAKLSLQTLEEKLAEHKTWQESRNRRLAELGIAVDAAASLPSLLPTILSECDQKSDTLQKQRKAGETLSLQIGREVARSRIATVKNDLEIAQKERSVHKATIEGREATGKVASSLLDELREASAKISVQKLAEIEPFLQRIYARIDPHPAFRIVKLAARLSHGRGRLDTEIYDRNEDLSSDSPAAVLSSSQLNALAVSVFLSFNLALPKLPLDSVLLDDPIQSLDDINLLGMVDLLRRTKDKRQLIVSTHDERFGRLLERKLRPASSDHRTSVVQLTGWTRNGPTVQQYNVDAESVRLRMVKAG